MIHSSRFFAATAVATVALAGIAASADLYRRPLSAVVADGWHRFQLDAEAQANIDGAWLGDDDGRPVPFMRQRELMPRRDALAVSQLITGRADGDGLSVEFRVDVAKPDRDEMEVTLVVEGTAPWIARVEIARRRDGSEWIGLESPVHIYEFNSAERQLAFTVPRDAPEWRLRVNPLQGELRRVTQVTAHVARAGGAAAERDVSAEVSRVGRGWQIEAPDLLRVVAVDLIFDGTVAPVRAAVAVEEETKVGREPGRRVVGRGSVWRMPGLNSSETTVRLEAPVIARRLALELPAGVELRGARLRVQEEQVWFVAEAGKRYALHFGGEQRLTAGNLRDLPAEVWRSAPPVLTLGSRESDPHGQPRGREWSAELRRWLPWSIAVIVALMAVVAWRLMRAAPSRDP